MLGTREFAAAVVERLGQRPALLPAVSYPGAAARITAARSRPTPAQKELVGVDVFIDARDTTADQIAATISAINHTLTLNMITNRGTKVWPNGFPETFCTDHWRCRFKSGGATDYKEVISLLKNLNELGLQIIKTENLYLFNGERGYTAAQGE